MSGLFDMHVSMHLQVYWDWLRAYEARFQALFSGAVQDDMIKDWYDKLKNNDVVRFAVAYAPEQRQFPQVTVALQEEPLEKQPFSFSGGRDDDGNAITTMLVRETVAIRIYSPLPALTRALHVAVQAAMMTGANWFLKLGYSDLQYGGGQDLQPDLELMPEMLGIFLREQRWFAVSEPTIVVASEIGKRPFVHATDVTIDGKTGGVSANTEDRS